MKEFTYILQNIYTTCVILEKEMYAKYAVNKMWAVSEGGEGGGSCRKPEGTFFDSRRSFKVEWQTHCLGLSCKVEITWHSSRVIETVLWLKDNFNQ